MDYQQVVKILQGQATDQEKTDFFARCEEFPEEKAEYIRIKNFWTLSVNEKIPSWQKSFDSFWSKTQTKKRIIRRNLIFELGKYAAVILITLGLAFFLKGEFNSSEKDLVQTFSSEQGSVSSILLSDGSRIWLNSGSTLHFVKRSKNYIEAKLSGEGYFEIEHNPDREFVVQTGNLRIHDLGTKFNIKAYEEDEGISATLAEGIIEIRNEEGVRLLEMKPNDHFEFNKLTSHSLLKTVDPALTAGWKDGKFVFMDMDLAEICRELEKWYGVEISIRNKEIGNEKYSSVLKRTTTIEQMMEMLKLTANIQYKIITDQDGIDEIVIQ